MLLTHFPRRIVFGAGNIGSLYAALLKESGQDVSILARGKRLADIREHGIQLEDVVTGKQTTAHFRAAEGFDAHDAYDVVLVVLPKNHVSEVLPILRESRQTPSVVFFGNNAAGPREMIEEYRRVGEKLAAQFEDVSLAPDCRVIISGDKRVLAASGYERAEVLRPRSFLERYL